MSRITLCFLLLLFAPALFSQTSPAENTLSTPIKANSDATSTTDEIPEPEKIEIIYSEDSASMLHAILTLSRLMEKQIGENGTEYAKNKRAILEQELLLIELNDSNFDRSGITPLSTEKFDWKESISTILEPLLSSLNSLTAKPRETSENEQQLSYIKQRVESFKHGLEVLSQIKQRYPSKSEESLAITKTEIYWKRKLVEAERLNTRLEEKAAALSREKPIAEQVNAGIAKAFVNKLITIVWAILAAVFTYALFNWIANIFNNLERRTKNERTKFAHRLSYFGIKILSSVLSLLSVFIVIYLRSDWVLLGLILIALFFLAIGLKDTIPGYLTEIRTMLNLGSVKEGQRIIYQGIPWKVETLGMYTHLHNPALDAHFHIALSNLSNLNSRPYHSDEPFFPTSKNDWVRLSDGTYGKVTSQSPENVILSCWKSVVTIPTDKFLSLSPSNLSRQEILITTTFGIDYKYQSIITSQAKEQLNAFLQQVPHPEKANDHIQSIKVEFKAASTSSLDFLIICVADGGAADSIFAIERWLAASCVDAANYYNWIIPFQQITVHKE